LKSSFQGEIGKELRAKTGEAKRNEGKQIIKGLLNSRV
jgi:hypothetical protein